MLSKSDMVETAGARYTREHDRPSDGFSTMPSQTEMRESESSDTIEMAKITCWGYIELC